MSMIFRYSSSPNWLKGNTHVHSTRSDGTLSPELICDLYARAGYDFIALTDHWTAGDALLGANDSILVMNGLELDGLDPNGAYHHIVVLGELTGIQDTLAASDPTDRTAALQPLIERLDPGKTFSVWAHPHWTRNTFEDGLQFECDALEVFNSCSQVEIGRGYGMSHWDFLLKQRPNLLGVAADDAHHTPRLPSWGGGWIMVNTQHRDQESVLQALKSGEFYASSGPEFYSFAYDGRSVIIETSPVQVIRLIGPGLHGHPKVARTGEAPLRQASFDLKDCQHPLRLEIQDFQGGIAWSNPLFILSNGS